MKLFLLIVAAAICAQAEELQKFPDDFLFGTATASYQIEGGWNADGKGENIWDHMTHTQPWVIADMSNGDIADNTYYNYKRDVQMMRELNLDAYRFSLSWSRILPTGFSNQINDAGVAFYNNYINEMLRYNITPMITLYHWDLPQPLQDLGGWMNPHIVDWFADYARVAFEKFSDRVQIWVTFNEPKEFCYQGFEVTTQAPMINATGVGIYFCAKNVVLAHARAYKLFDSEFRRTGGKCGIVMVDNWYIAASPEDEDAVQSYRDFKVGLYAHPIFIGDFPPNLKQRVAEKSAKQGYARSRLPEMTAEEVEYVKGTYDFWGCNHYTTSYVYHKDPEQTDVVVPSQDDDCGASTYQVGIAAASEWIVFGNDSLYHTLKYVHENYGAPEIIVTENGWSSFGGIEDDIRVEYYKHQISGMLNAINEGVKVTGYMAWSLMDNFEWRNGYSERFGLYEVDQQDPARTRTPRKSAFVYKEIVRTRTVDPNYEPDTRTMWIEEGH